MIQLFRQKLSPFTVVNECFAHSLGGYSLNSAAEKKIYGAAKKLTTLIRLRAWKRNSR